MKPGQRRKPDHLKVINGTAQPCRLEGTKKDAMKTATQAFAHERAAIKRPAWIKKEAKQVWDRVFPLLVGAGKADDAHFDVIVSYCLLAGKQIEQAKAGKLLAAADRMELRRVGEALGLVKIDSNPDGGGKKPKKNQFGNNKR